ncbi:MAG: hypothetical protein RBU30_17590, partial [Polyangia bacterium]|jgi:hypothetical protein|nr:hypothetical protein [Polyangia bacterium]
MEVTELAPTDALVESFELSERYLVWAAYVQDPDPQSQGRTVLYKDLETGEVTAVEASKPRLQYHVRTHGDYILWEGGDVYLEPPSHLMLHHIPTGDSTIITELEGTNPLGDVHGRVVALSTTHYRTDGQLTFWPSDVALYDIDSEVMRRVTVQSGYLRAMRLSDQHLLVAEFTGPSPQSWNWYLLDLRQLGLVDEEGHVLEGEPVFDPSEPPGIR